MSGGFDATAGEIDWYYLEVEPLKYRLWRCFAAGVPAGVYLALQALEAPCVVWC